MRWPSQPQLWFTAPITNHERFAELQAMDKVLDANPQFAELVHADLSRGIDPNKGRKGMTAEQVLRIFIVKQTFGFTYDDLSFHLADSTSYRWFCRLDCSQKVKKSTMQRDIKKLRPETLEAISCKLVHDAREQDFESMRKVRTDCTGVETMIHEPTDSSLLQDCVRVLARLLHKAGQLCPQISSRDHTRRANRRAQAIAYSRGKDKRNALYRDLLEVTGKTVNYAERAIPTLLATRMGKAEKLASELCHFIDLAKRVIAQTRRRVIEGESVPVADKIVSIFEPHSDIIVKGNRDPLYGHKICLTAGASGLILDAVVLDGNPADSTLTVEMMERLASRYGNVPRQATFDGAFSSRDNLAAVKELGVEDVVFAKSKGIEIEDMAKSEGVYRQLRKFRAGVEATISFLKRSFALDRCTWRSLDSFKSYVWGSILSANLLILARHTLR